MKHVAITGPENAGKSDLAQALAEHYHTAYAREYAREFLNGTGGKYEFTDLDTICRGQLREEEKALSAAKGICFFDTDMLVLKIWSEYRFGKVSDFINENFEKRIYHHYLLCAPDLPWTPDPFRESPSLEEREHLFARYKRELERRKASFSIIEGTGSTRVGRAIAAITEWGYSL